MNWDEVKEAFLDEFKVVFIDEKKSLETRQNKDLLKDVLYELKEGFIKEL